MYIYPGKLLILLYWRMLPGEVNILPFSILSLFSFFFFFFFCRPITYISPHTLTNQIIKNPNEHNKIEAAAQASKIK